MGHRLSLHHILAMILVVTALRVVSSMPTALRANWIIRVPQTRPALAYQEAVRFSWLVLAVAPVLFFLSGAALSAPAQALGFAGHLFAMLLFGVLLVEFCLYTFPKIPFTCSYLPGKANIHFVFWASLMLFLVLIHKSAVFESRMLHQPYQELSTLFGLALAALAMRGLVQRRAVNSKELLFEEAEEVEIISLKLS